MHPSLSATATPGSRQILAAIAESGVYRQLSDGGVRMLEPVCGPCAGMGQAPPSDANSLRTSNRNFPGRSGTPEDSVFLCSPAVAAVSLLTGRIEDPREYPSGSRSAGPNIKRPPGHTPLPESLEARIATVQADDISTGDLAPEGVEVMAYRSNVPAIAEFTLRHRDPEFRKRLKEQGGGFIVAGESYEVGQCWVLPELRQELADGAERIKALIRDDDAELTLTHDCSEHERETLVAGGLPAYPGEPED